MFVFRPFISVLYAFPRGAWERAVEPGIDVYRRVEEQGTSDEMHMSNHILKPCPNKPNCVSSLASNKGNAVEPLHYSGDWLAVKKALLDLIEQTPRAAVVDNDNEYVHAIFKSRIFGFVDDVEFLFDDAHKIIHIRSSARLGYYDFGVNRKRVEMLRSRLAT
jgi:uncharacterized protein (DUF1499 family)